MMQTRTDLGFEHVLVRGSSSVTLLLLHATGGDEHQLVALGSELAPDATLLSPRGKVLENGTTRRFFRRHGLLNLDIPDLLDRTDELAAFVGDAVTAYELDPDRVVALGYSNGANIAASLLLRRPETLGGAALLRATMPYEPDDAIPLSGRTVLVTAGARDPYVPRASSDRLVEALGDRGAEVAYRVIDAGHELVAEDLAAAGAWLADLTPDGDG